MQTKGPGFWCTWPAHLGHLLKEARLLYAQASPKCGASSWKTGGVSNRATQNEHKFTFVPVIRGVVLGSMGLATMRWSYLHLKSGVGLLCCEFSSLCLSNTAPWNDPFATTCRLTAAPGTDLILNSWLPLPVHYLQLLTIRARKRKQLWITRCHLFKGSHQ